MFFARLSGSRAGESKAVTPWVAHSRTPTMSVAASAQPQAIASMGGAGDPSLQLGHTKTLLRL